MLERGTQLATRLTRSAISLHFCDSDVMKLNEVGRHFPGVKLVSNATDILNDPNIDLVSIASYDQFHGDQILAALRSEKHVFVEKPLCLTRKEFINIKQALGANPHLKLSSNFVLREVERFKQLKSRIESNEFGDLYYFEGDYDYGRLHKITQGWRADTEGYSVVHGGRYI